VGRPAVVPLHEALHRPLGLAEQTDPRRYLHIPKNFSDDDAEIRIDLPGHLDSPATSSRTASRRNSPWKA
jgi:hypothetical protein